MNKLLGELQVKLIFVHTYSQFANCALIAESTELLALKHVHNISESYHDLHATVVFNELRQILNQTAAIST